MKGIVIIISAVLFVALMLTSCRNYYNMVEPDEEDIEITKAKQDPEPIDQDRIIEGKQDTEPRYSRPPKTFDADMGGGGSTLDQYHVDLIAGGGGDGGLDVGDVVVWNDADYIYVKYLMLDADWCLSKTSLEVTRTLAEIPQMKGNPKVGQFTWKAALGFLPEYTEVIPLAAEPGTTVLIAAHATVNKVANQNVTETAWGKGRDFPGMSWAMYFTYTVAFAQSGGGGESPASDDF
jgi:hypothetical protein